MSAVVVAITNEMLDEMARWTFEEYKKFVPNAGNLNWLNNQLTARLELVEHMKHTFGGLK
jgi:ribosome biogenesis SPOUT family RNA methylase Rps3